MVAKFIAFYYIKEGVASYHVLKPNVLQKNYAITKFKYFYNAESKYRSLKAWCLIRNLPHYLRDFFKLKWVISNFLYSKGAFEVILEKCLL